MDLHLETITGLPWGAVFRLVAILYVAIVLHIAVTALLSVVFSARIEEISIGALIPVFKTRIANMTLSLKAIPVSGHIQYAEPEDAKTAPIIHRERGRYFRQLPAVLTIIIALTGCLALLQIAVLLAGKGAVITGFAIWGQFIAGALGPFSVAQTYLADMSNYIQTAPLETLVAVVFAKYAAFNLLPLGGLNGGVLFVVFLEKLFPVLVPLGDLFLKRVVTLYLQLSVILLLMMFASWLVAFLYFLF